MFPSVARNQSPYPWQTALFEQFASGDLPQSLALPTGSGKTAIMQVWLLALAWNQLNHAPFAFPRRLIWVVNRRAVVDQATTEAETIRTQLAEDVAKTLRQALESCSPSRLPLAISTLRGEHADNRQWSDDPLRPAIVVGTVDMIGSRLLFRGYGSSRTARPRHAALLGVDTLIVCDESHLSPAFSRLLRSIHELSPSAKLQRQFQVMAVSATAEPTAEKSFVHNLDEDLAASPAFHAVFFAEKRLHFAEAAAGGAATLAKILALAKVGSSRTLVFVEEPENAAEIAAKLAAACSPDRVALMTGTMRGLERDRLTRSEVFRIFTEHVPPPEPCFFVATSAAEVGINITSERLVTVAVESDRLLQRLGRLNRFGGAPAEAIVVTDPKTRNLPRIAETLAYLHALPALSDGARDVSCAALRRAGPPPPESRTELPAFARFDARLLDLWAQTSVASPVIPDVEPWLHGLQKSIPETEVAWREEVERLATAAVDERSREDAFNRYRVLPHERLKEPTYRLQEKLEAIAAKSPDTAVLFRTRDGSVIYSTLSVVCRWKVPQLNHGLLLLPPGCGGLTAHGMFTTDASAEGVPYDVADEDVGGTAARNAHRCRYLVEGGQWRRLGSDSPDPDPPSSLNAATLAAYARERGFGAPIKVEIQDGSDTGEESSYLVFFPERQQTYPPSPRILLREHLDHAAECSRQIAVSAGCDHLAESFRQAGLWHDEGKRHHLWQKAMGGSTTEPLAKTPAPAAPRLLNGFRHELASLKSTLEQATLDDLALHLVASHHGWARPHWTTRAYDRDALGSSEIAALEAARRFARLQQLWGHWGLAYLETLFKAADALSEQEGGSDA